MAQMVNDITINPIIELLAEQGFEGLHGVELIISDAQSYVPKQSMKREVATDIRSVLQAPNLEEAERLLKVFC